MLSELPLCWREKAFDKQIIRVKTGVFLLTLLHTSNKNGTFVAKKEEEHECTKSKRTLI